MQKSNFEKLILPHSAQREDLSNPKGKKERRKEGKKESRKEGERKSIKEEKENNEIR